MKIAQGGGGVLFFRLKIFEIKEILRMRNEPPK